MHPSLLSTAISFSAMLYRTSQPRGPVIECFPAEQRECHRLGELVMCSAFMVE
jgi:hypothetical protein